MAHKVVNYETESYRIREVFISMHKEEDTRETFV